MPQSHSLLLRVDRVVSDSDLDPLLLLSFLKTLFKSLLSTFLSPKSFTFPSNDEAPTNPARILRGFDRIRELDIELPAGDLRLEKGTLVRYCLIARPELEFRRLCFPQFERRTSDEFLLCTLPVVEAMTMRFEFIIL